MRADLLATLADFLEGLEARKFDMGQWSNEEDGKTPSCGFVGCAGGWAAHAGIVENLEIAPEGGIRYYRGYSVYSLGLTAMMDAFELSELDARWLFVLPLEIPKLRNNPIGVATRIRNFISVKEMKVRQNEFVISSQSKK